MPPLELAKATSAQITGLPRSQTVFFFPVGPLEDHGPHLPMGLDLLEANRLCQMAAERLERDMAGWRGVIMPHAPLGIDSDTGALAITVRGHVLRDWLVDACRSLSRVGFKHFVCFSGHLGPKQLTAIEEAGKKIYGPFRMGPLFAGRPTLVSACSAIVGSAVVKASPLWPDPVEHGGKRDTSVALFLAGEQVGVQQGTLPSIARESSFWARASKRMRRKISGYWGDPAAATAAEGEKVLTGTLDQIFPKLRAVWEGANPEFVFRSWYSVLPLNKSFFKAWILAILIVLVLLACVILVLQTAFMAN